MPSLTTFCKPFSPCWRTPSGRGQSGSRSTRRCWRYGTNGAHGVLLYCTVPRLLLARREDGPSGRGTRAGMRPHLPALRLQGWQLLEDGKAGGAVARHEDVGLAVLRPPRPLHYYCLFSHALGLDVVVSWGPLAAVLGTGLPQGEERGPSPQAAPQHFCSCLLPAPKLALGRQRSDHATSCHSCACTLAAGTSWSAATPNM